MGKVSFGQVEIGMPYGKGTYGSRVGRPKKKKRKNKKRKK